MNNDLQARFNTAKSLLTQRKSDYDTASANQQPYTQAAFERYQQQPRGCSGYEEVTTPISSLGTVYKQRTEQGYKLAAMRPSQFSVVMVWQPKTLKPADVEKMNRQHAENEWLRHITPLAQALADAQSNYDTVAAEVTAMKSLFEQVA